MEDLAELRVGLADAAAYFVDVDYTAYKISIEPGTIEKIVENSAGIEDCGDQLLMDYRDSGRDRIALRDRSGHERDVARLPGCTVDSPPHCDLAGKRAVFALSACTWDLQPPSDIEVLDLSTGVVTNVTRHPEEHNTSPAFTPDGSIVFASRP